MAASSFGGSNSEACFGSVILRFFEMGSVGTIEDAARRAAARRLFGNLPAEEQAEFEALARFKMLHTARGGGSLAETMCAIEKVRITAQRYPEQIPTFEQWQARRVA